MVRMYIDVVLVASGRHTVPLLTRLKLYIPYVEISNKEFWLGKVFYEIVIAKRSVLGAQLMGQIFI